MTLVAIHQPTFLPWLGWWDKLVRADVFVLLDEVQFSKKGGTWMNRVRLLVGGEPRWVTMPVDRAYAGTRSVREMRIDDSKPWRQKVLTTIRATYGRAPFADDVMPAVQEAVGARTELVAELNERAIRSFAERLEIDTTKIVRQSELAADGHGTQLLVELCRAVGGDAYLSGDGSDGYLDAEAFAVAGLELLFQEFAAPVYPQPTDTFVPGLSAVDALMNCGWQGTAELLRTTRS
jgi:WbqC-like protein family